MMKTMEIDVFSHELERKMRTKLSIVILFSVLLSFQFGCTWNISRVGEGFDERNAGVTTIRIDSTQFHHLDYQNQIEELINKKVILSTIDNLIIKGVLIEFKDKKHFLIDVTSDDLFSGSKIEFYPANNIITLTHIDNSKSGHCGEISGFLVGLLIDAIIIAIVSSNLGTMGT